MPPRPLTEVERWILRAKRCKSRNWAQRRAVLVKFVVGWTDPQPDPMRVDALLIRNSPRAQELLKAAWEEYDSIPF